MARRKKTIQKAREIQEQAADDPFRNFQGDWSELQFMRFTHWLKRNAREVLIGGAILLVVGIGTVIYFVWAEGREQDSIVAFEEVTASQMGNVVLAQSVALEDLQKYAEEYTHDRARLRAHVYQVDLLIDQDQRQAAADTCRKIAEEAESPELRSYYYMRAGFLYEDAEQFQQAREAFRLAASFFREPHMLQAEARFGEARSAYAMGDSEGGRAAMQQLFAIKDATDLEKVYGRALAFYLRQER